MSDDTGRARYPIEFGEAGYSRVELRDAPPDIQIAAIAFWFRSRFEDLAQNTPYNNREGGYQYIWGGPFDAMDEIASEFEGVVPQEIVERAVEEVQAEGIYDWAPVPGTDDGELSDEEMDAFIDTFAVDPDDRVARGEIVDGDGPWPPIVAVPPTLPDPDRAVTELKERLDRLEELVVPLASASPGIGHNNPPEPIDEYPLDPQDGRELLTSVGGLREEADRVPPDGDRVRSWQTRLSRIAAKIGVWLGERITKGVDVAIAVMVTTGVVTVLADPRVVQIAIEGVVRAAGAFLQVFGVPL